MPRRPGSRLLFGDGSEMPCLIIDMSSSGAALSADIRPPLGYPLAVGKVVGKVVRYLEVGFAVQFLEERAVEDLERLLGVGDEAMAEYFSGEWTTGPEGADNLPETASEQGECTQSDAMPATGT
jgi:hypothetical protein